MYMWRVWWNIAYIVADAEVFTIRTYQYMYMYVLYLYTVHVYMPTIKS